jgi:Uma2 family endonuclease
MKNGVRPRFRELRGQLPDAAQRYPKMPLMDVAQELTEAPLSSEALAARYRELCDDPRFANLPGKIELDGWGRILMSPASNYHGQLQGRLCRILGLLPGEAFVEGSVVSADRLLVPDVVWASAAFLAAHRNETPYTQAPEICIEVVSPSNSLQELRDKVAQYLLLGAVEAWIVYPQSRRIEFFGRQGSLAASAYPVDLSSLFD